MPPQPDTRGYAPYLFQRKDTVDNPNNEIHMTATTLSRWTTLHFAVALVAFIIAQAAILAGWAYPTVPAENPTSLAVLHLLTIGWLTVLILGALQQFVPMVSGHPAKNGSVALLPLGAIIFGLAGMVAGFLSLAGVFTAAVLPALPAGGLLVMLGIASAATSLAWPLCDMHPMALPARFVLAGLVFLLATAGLGVCLAAVLAFPAVFSWGRILGAGVGSHAAGGLIGWCTLTAMGVSYRLIAMFISAPDSNGRLGHSALVATAGGLAVAWLAGVGLTDLPTWQTTTTNVGAASAIVGVMLYLADMVQLFRARRRRTLELHSASAIASLAALAFGAALLAGSRFGAVPGDAIEPAACLLVFGWLSGLGLAQLYKLVPFLTWLRRYGPLLGKASVPGIDALTNERRAGPWFVLYFAAVAFGTGCGLLAWPMLWRMAVAMHFLATLGIARELRRVSRWPSARVPVAGQAIFGESQAQHGALG